MFSRETTFGHVRQASASTRGAQNTGDRFDSNLAVGGLPAPPRCLLAREHRGRLRASAAVQAGLQKAVEYRRILKARSRLAGWLVNRIIFKN